MEVVSWSGGTASERYPGCRGTEIWSSTILVRYRLSHVHDGYGAIDGNRVFYPASQEEWSPGLAPDPVGFMLNAYQPLLISEGAQHTLVDTGFGEENPRRKRSMFESLQQVGVHPDEIARVIITMLMGIILAEIGRAHV